MLQSSGLVNWNLFLNHQDLGDFPFILLGIGLSVSDFHTQSIGIKENFGQIDELLPFGFAGMVVSFPMVLFSFAGIEMIGNRWRDK